MMMMVHPPALNQGGGGGIILGTVGGGMCNKEDMGDGANLAPGSGSSSPDVGKKKKNAKKVV